MKINNYIFKLLQEHDCVVIPNFGAFVTRNISSKISSDGVKIFPPNKEVSFNKSIIKNDGLLINLISSSENINYETAEKKLANWTARINKKIQKNNYIEIKNIGCIALEKNNYVFTPNRKSVFLKYSYGLSSIDSQEIIRSKKITNNPYLKYAAILIVFLTLGGIFTKTYFDNVNQFNEASYYFL